MKIKYLDFAKDFTPDKTALPFSNIKIIDARFDTTCIGFSKAASADKINFRSGTTVELADYIRINYKMAPQTDSSYQLVIVLEKFWVSGLLVMGERERGQMPDITRGGPLGWNKNTDRETGKKVFNNGLVVKANFLAFKNGMYHPIYKIDSTYLSNVNSYDPIIILQDGIDVCLQPLINKNIADIKISRKSLNDSDINNFIAQRLALPILQTAQYNRGVFKSFDEFKNNQPSITEFEIGSNNSTDALYVKDEKGSKYLLQNFWGYSDGMNIYINTGDNFFEIFKDGNGFVFYGFTIIAKRDYVNTGKLITGTLLLGVLNGYNIGHDTHYRGKKASLCVDMDTGNAY